MRVQTGHDSVAGRGHCSLSRWWGMKGVFECDCGRVRMPAAMRTDRKFAATRLSCRSSQGLLASWGIDVKRCGCLLSRASQESTAQLAIEVKQLKGALDERLDGFTEDVREEVGQGMAKVTSPDMMDTQWRPARTPWPPWYRMFHSSYTLRPMPSTRHLDPCDVARANRLLIPHLVSKSRGS